MKIKNIVFSGLLATSLMVSAVPAMARDYWHWHHDRWERRADLRTEQDDLNRARRQLNYDRAHHASRRVIAQDEARIRDIERDLREDHRMAHR